MNPQNCGIRLKFILQPSAHPDFFPFASQEQRSSLVTTPCQRNTCSPLLARRLWTHGAQTDGQRIAVDDLGETIDFFRELGLELEGRAMIEGEWAGRVTGLGDQRVEIAMMRTPDGTVSLPDWIGLGGRHVSFHPAYRAVDVHNLRCVSFGVFITAYLPPTVALAESVASSRGLSYFAWNTRLSTRVRSK